MAVHVTRAGVALTVGIIVVTGLIVAGLFIAKESGEQARREDAIAIAEQTLEEQLTTDGALNGVDGNSQDHSNDGTSKTDDNTTANEEQSAGSNAESSESEGSSNGSNETATELPRTGIADAGAVVGLSLTTFMGAAYYRSRKQLVR